MDNASTRATAAPEKRIPPVESDNLVTIRARLAAAAHAGEPITLSGRSACALYVAMDTGKPMPADDPAEPQPVQQHSGNPASTEGIPKRAWSKEAEMMESWANPASTGREAQYPHPDCDWACHYHCTEAGAHPPKCAAPELDVEAEREACAQICERLESMMTQGAGEARPGERLSQAARLIRERSRLAATGSQAERAPDRAEFEAQAKHQGATNFTLVHPDFLVCNNGWTPATYRDPMTELAWRVWANKPVPSPHSPVGAKEQDNG